MNMHYANESMHMQMRSHGLARALRQRDIQIDRQKPKSPTVSRQLVTHICPSSDRESWAQRRMYSPNFASIISPACYTLHSHGNAGEIIVSQSYM